MRPDLSEDSLGTKTRAGAAARSLETLEAKQVYAFLIAAVTRRVALTTRIGLTDS